jgi:hypothetical protein
MSHGTAKGDQTPLIPAVPWGQINWNCGLSLAQLSQLIEECWPETSWDNWPGMSRASNPRAAPDTLRAVRITAMATTCATTWYYMMLLLNIGIASRRRTFTGRLLMFEAKDGLKIAGAFGRSIHPGHPLHCHNLTQRSWPARKRYEHESAWSACFNAFLVQIHISTFSTASKPYSIHLNPFMRLSCSNHQSGWNQPCRVTQWSHSPAFTCWFTNNTGCLPAYHQTLGAPQMRATSSRGSPNPMACHLCAANILQWPAGKLHEFKKLKGAGRTHQIQADKLRDRLGRRLSTSDLQSAQKQLQETQSGLV